MPVPKMGVPEDESDLMGYGSMMPVDKQGDASLEAAPTGEEGAPPAQQVAPIKREAGYAGPELVEQKPAEPSSVLGDKVPSGQQIPEQEMHHARMKDLEHRAGAVSSSIVGLNPNDPNYIQKLGALHGQQGAITTEKAHQERMNPWGTEGNHPGILGKIGHTLGTIGNVAGNALIPNVMSSIPGTQANLASQERKGMAEQQEAGNEEKQAAETHNLESESKLKSEQAEVAGNPKPEKPENVQQIYSDAVQDAVNRGVDPNTDPKVKQLADTITSLQKPTNTPAEKIDQQYQEALESGDHEKAERLLKVKADLAKAGQAPQRAPQTLVVTPGGQVDVARPGSKLEPGTQNIGGFATQNRPTTQMRNVGAQAQVASEGIPQVVSEIDRLKDKLGPVSGRWNEFMQGKVGMENPEMAGLRADLLMVSSAVALAHARGRLPENLREEFDRAINVPKQDPENLKSVLNHILPWMQRMEQMQNVTGGGETAPAAPTPTSGGGGGFKTWLDSQKAKQGK